MSTVCVSSCYNACSELNVILHRYEVLRDQLPLTVILTLRLAQALATHSVILNYDIFIYIVIL